MSVYLQDADFTLWNGDSLEVLRTLPDESVHCVVTSPPYWGLRDYGTGTWEGGNPDCDHIRDVVTRGTTDDRKGWDGNFRATAQPLPMAYSEVCGKCGARRVDQQLGLEPTPDAYVTNMVTLFREVRRVLRRDGTCWLNLGDSYNGSGGAGGNANESRPSGMSGNFRVSADRLRDRATSLPTRIVNLKPKDLVGIPWRVAFALQQPYYAGRIPDERQREWLAAIIDGEGSIALNYLKPTETNDRNHDYFGPYLRVHNTCEAIVRRCAEITGVGSVKVHDARRRPVYVWAVYGATAREILREVYPHLIAKQHEARLAYASPGSEDCYAGLKLLHKGSETTVDRPAPPSCLEPGWYLRSDIIWSKPNPMPESVTDRPTKAHEYLFLLTRSARYFYDADAIREPAEWARWGDQTNGKHEGQQTSAGWIKSKTKADLNANRSSYKPGSASNMNDGEHVKKSDAGLPLNPLGRNARSVWKIPTLPYPQAHFATFPEELARRCIAAGSPQDGLILDPFMGSGTVAHVARKLGRRSIGIELNPDYCELAARRLQQQSLLA